MKWFLVLLLVLATTAGDVFRSLGMKHHGEIEDFRPDSLGRALAALVRNRYVIFSTLWMALSFFAFIKLVAIAPMSFAVPMSAATFVPETILARLILKERVDWRRWTGAMIIALGVVFISQ